MFDWKRKAGDIAHNAPLLQPLYHAFGGLCEFYCAILIGATIYFELHGKLEASFAAAITAICGILAIHDALDDRLPQAAAQQTQAQAQTTQVVNDITVDSNAPPADSGSNAPKS